MHGGAEGSETRLPKRIVVLDTDRGVRWAIEKGLQRSGYEVLTAASVAEGLRFANEDSIDAVLLEILPEAGLTQEALRMFLESSSAPKVICLSVDSAPQHVIDCMRQGAADFLPKPFSLQDVRAALARALATERERRAVRSGSTARRPEEDSTFLIGISPAMNELRDVIKQVSGSDLNCLIRGESGTGKDLIARELHRLSRRADKPFVKVNCTALPEQLLESELFGYERGAFTGAVASKPGRFELAHRGIIFLDEIGDMHPNLQAKLLQVIEHKEFTKLGGRKSIKVDVQIVAATNADLEARTKDGSFRDDLYFRLNEVCVWVPPLSDRREDIPLLVRHFLEKHGRFSNDSTFEISGSDLQELTEHEWPGNVRELESTIKRWLALGKKVLVTQRTTPRRAQPAPEAVSPAPPEPVRAAAPVPAEAATDAQSDPDRILAALERNQWNRRKTAGELGMSYQTLRRRIEKYELDQRR
jgi:DNA-binding NtrC family response regulator